MEQKRIVSFDANVMVLNDGTELPIVFEIDPDITLEELNDLYVKSNTFVESLKDVRSDNYYSPKLG